MFQSLYQIKLFNGEKPIELTAGPISKIRSATEEIPIAHPSKSNLVHSQRFFVSPKDVLLF